ncbi:phosphoethanolamine transferase [Pectinatus frisingensis]|uniref:phosphoethanolamine transferase n=1 Tax=Pectinatus frisingensis TaxID=865 RepID=UPI001E4DEDCE|nr:phosphoethanolamine transferase [Pectinatus frisingensis]
MDLLFGVGLFVFLTLVETILPLKQAKVTAVIFTVINFVCLVIPFLEWAYYLIFWHCLTPASLMAVYLTNINESINFVQVNLKLNIVIFMGMLIIFIYAAYKCNRVIIAKTQFSYFSKKQKTASIFLLVLMIVYLYSVFPHNSIMLNWLDISNYMNQTQRYTTEYSKRYDDLILDKKETLAQTVPGTVILVVGESASRNYMKAYTPDFPFDDTPWLQQCMNDDNFIVFRNVYSCWVQTVPVIERALTEASQYNKKKFFESSSVLDVAKKAGYKTYWFSNQGKYDEYDGAITLIAKTADHSEWMDDSYVFTEKYDGSLLQALPKVDPNKNNFIIIHLIGSHFTYANRYPAEFEKWKGKGKISADDSYANSILYTDYILSQIFDYASNNMHLQAMMYCSDHGEDMKITHNPDNFKFDMARIPMFVYLSPEYQKNFPIQTNILRNNENQFFTNDMLYDTICGILNAASNHYDAGQDFSSPQYRFNLQNLTTMLGQKKLTEDPYLNN